MGVEIWKHRACCYTSLLRAHLLSCTRRFVAASLRGGHTVLPGYSVWGEFVSFKFGHIFCCILAWYMFGFWSSGEWDCMVSSQRQRCMLARHLLVVHTLQVWLHVSQNISGVCIVLVSKMQTNPVSTSQAQVMECPFLPIGSLSLPPLKL